MSTATHLRDLGTHQRLYRLDPPLKDHEYVVVSTTDIGGDETLIFPANEAGEITDLTEIGGFRGSRNFEGALHHAGYRLDRPSRVREIGSNAYEALKELVEAMGDECPACEGTGDCPVDTCDGGNVGDDNCDACGGLAECVKCDGTGERDLVAREDGRERIVEDPLSVQVRSGWYTPGGDSSPEEYEILLSTGGPASRIIGELDRFGEPTSARLQVQDWFQPWTEYLDADRDVLLEYARCFYYGEGE